MDILLVLESFILVSGLTREEAERWLPLCHWAVASIYGRLRPEADVIANQTALCYAAGTMAYYKFVLREVAQSNRSQFSVGDVSLTEDHAETMEAAKALYEDALRSVEHLFGDEFAFVGVVT